MRTLELLARAKADGLSIEPEGQLLHLRGSREVIERWTPAVQEQKAAILAELSRPCDRCSVAGGRLVASYWGPFFCPTCCALVAFQHDENDSWPAASFGDSSAGWAWDD